MSGVDWLRENLQRVFELPGDAVEWLVMLYDAIQVFDDVADGDTVLRKDLDSAIWNTLVAMPSNRFYVTNAAHLAPLVASMILKWQASDKAERMGQASVVSFVWRAGFYDVVLAVVLLCKGPQYATENAHLVMNLYGEFYETYMKEFENA